jgi:hypothetical protein
VVRAAVFLFFFFFFFSLLHAFLSSPHHDLPSFFMDAS